jgi:hypothetical protein
MSTTAFSSVSPIDTLRIFKRVEDMHLPVTTVHANTTLITRLARVVHSLGYTKFDYVPAETRYYIEAGPDGTLTVSAVSPTDHVIAEHI